jgi:large-conductance mechanosensitive channel
MNTLLDINPFLTFLDKFNIIPLAFSLIISLNLNQLSNTFIQTMISPIINKLFNNDNIKLKDQEITILGIKFEFGLFLINLIQFIFTLIILYILYLLYKYISNDNMNDDNTKIKLL